MQAVSKPPTGHQKLLSHIRETEQDNGNRGKGAVSHATSSLEGARDPITNRCAMFPCAPVADDPGRAGRFSIEAAGLFSITRRMHHRGDAQARLEPAEESGLRERIDAMFRGDKINITAKRAVLHVAFARPKVRPSSSMARMSSRVHAVLIRRPPFPTACAVATGKAIRQAHRT